ncbi:hypothetical protein BDN72DRAFT_894856 [Pluteus cervinus]|uniref:Uncharacterized protein n=1 Tax=Pluteus cervinus TaxID=181527 RepID=A0ACD3B3Z8_9AGAR|nr:hypothetical protein BDN72DRAFT_894856 [Pluteus cervinus]
MSSESAQRSTSAAPAPAVAPPPQGRLLSLPGRDPDLPALYEVDEHIQVPNKGPNQRILVLYQDLQGQSLWKTFRKVAKWAPPRSDSERIEEGFDILDPENEDVLFLRDMHGTGNEKDDVLKSWAIHEGYYTDDELAELIQLQTDLIGPEKLVRPYKAFKTPNGYEGGIEYERSDQAVSIVEGSRAYWVAMSLQIQRFLLAPSTGNKRQEGIGAKCDHTELNNRLIRLGTRASVRGMKKAPLSTRDALHIQAELTNFPHIGHDENCCQTNYQLNVAHAAPAGSNENLTTSLGQFGGTHIDKYDSTTAPTAMTILSQSSDDVELENFYLMDLGIAVRLRRFTTAFFFGVHFHSGAQPMFKRNVINPLPYYRLTLIKYPSFSALDTPSAVAFAGLPPNGDVLNLSTEMRDPRLDPLTYKYLNPDWRTLSPPERPSTQATSLYDMGSLLSRKAYLDHLGRGVDQLVAYLVSQAPEDYHVQWDKDKLVTAFSLINEAGKRIQAEPWDLGPGWPSSSIHIGKNINDEQPRNPGKMVPYDNQPRIDAMKKWAQHVNTTGNTTAVSILCDRRDAASNIVGAHPQRRKGAINRARKEADVSEDTQKTVQDRKGKRKATDEGPHPPKATRSKRSRNNQEFIDERMMTDTDVIRQGSTLIQSLNLDHLLQFESILTKPENQILLGSLFGDETRALALWEGDTDTNLSDVIKVTGELTRIWTSQFVGIPSQRLQEALIQMLNMTLWEWLYKFIRVLAFQFQTTDRKWCT